MDFDVTVFATRFLGIFIEAVPFLLLGTFASGLIEAFVSKDDITRVVPGNIVLATAMGGMMGFMFPVCECGVVPVTRRLFRKGMPISVGIAFLLSAPVMNPVVVASTYAAFGAGADSLSAIRHHRDCGDFSGDCFSLFRRARSGFCARKRWLPSRAVPARQLCPACKSHGLRPWLCKRRSHWPVRNSSRWAAFSFLVACWQP